MKAVKATVERFGNGRHAWTNRILRIDLSDMAISAQETPYIPDYIGARGVAARIAWDEYPEPVGEFDPANPLMIFPGALTGSRSPYSGRTIVRAFSPQGYPHPWFTRSSVGARFGGEIKRAGYDGIIVSGASDEPVRISIRDDEVSIVPASDLWGQDTLDTLEALESTEGRGTQSFVIGPAGERLSRIATIQAGPASACGQGGYGAVMGSKKLKSISVRGTGTVSLARPDLIAALRKELARVLTEERGQPGLWAHGGDLDALNEQLAAEGNGRARCVSCTEGCPTPCVPIFEDVPGTIDGGKMSGPWFCVSPLIFPGYGDAHEPLRSVFDWKLDRRTAFEMNVISNRYGLNQYDLLVGLVPWLVACQQEGLVSELNGEPMDWSSPEFWAHFLRDTTYRVGLGDALAEGGWAASRALGLGEDLAGTRYPGWGHSGHWDGHFGFAMPFFPYWLVPALQWLSETRDPLSSGLASVMPAFDAMRLCAASDGAERAAVVDDLRAFGAAIYGDPHATDPSSGYKSKAYPGYFHTLRSVMLDCVPVDDIMMPVLWSAKTPDQPIQLHNIDGLGDIDGPSAEYHLFAAGTGLDWSEEEFEQAVARVYTLERALHVRHWGRDRATDEMVLPYFERTEDGQNPLLGEQHGLDREQFKPVLDEFYTLHGWDPRTGWPTLERMRELGMADLYPPMVVGALRSKGERPMD